jgi:hypothetical protein
MPFSIFTPAITLTSGQAVLQHEIASCFIDFIAGGKDLVVSFEGAGPIVERPDGLRDGWGQLFLKKLGYSIVGVKPKRVNWYRDGDLHQFFRSKEWWGFTLNFRRVIFYGTSMGGFAALAFAESCPGCTVVAHNPQSSLDPLVVPNETRFVEGRRQDWSGDFNDGANAVKFAKRIYITYDPFHRQDKMQAARVSGHNVLHLKVPVVGHGTPDWLNKMGVLKDITMSMLDDTLTVERFAKSVRARRKLARYYTRLSELTRLPSVAAHCRAKAAEIDPENGELYAYGIDEAFIEQSYNRCVDLFMASSNLRGLPNAKRPEVLAKVAISLLRTGEPFPSAKMAREALSLSSESYGALCLLTDYFVEAKDMTNALVSAKRASVVRPDRDQPDELIKKSIAKVDEASRTKILEVRQHTS